MVFCLLFWPIAEFQVAENRKAAIKKKTNIKRVKNGKNDRIKDNRRKKTQNMNVEQQQQQHLNGMV